MAWFFEDEADPYAEAMEQAMASAAALVPALWSLEVGNALLMGERRIRTTEARVSKFLTLLSALPIVVDDESTSRAWSSVLHIARGQKLSTYDAAYLELAVRQAVPTATLDERLKAAAEDMGVELYRG